MGRGVADYGSKERVRMVLLGGDVFCTIGGREVDRRRECGLGGARCVESGE
jgi:hypothetical protein